MYDFAKEMYFDVKAPGKKLTRDRTPMKTLKSLGLLISATGISNTFFYHLILNMQPVNFVTTRKTSRKKF